jgi:hypothetical protein
MGPRLRIIVAGLVAQYPLGGVAWDYLQYVVGLKRLGHDVYYHEDTWSWPYHPIERTYSSDGAYSAAFLRDFFNRYAPDLADRWHYLHLHKESFGMGQDAFASVARSADLFLNVSGACPIPEDLSPRCVTVFIDTDPGYNQIVLSERFAWSENVDRWCASVRSHQCHFTYAENIHNVDCLVPRLDFNWKTTRMPVVIPLWDEIASRAPASGAPWSTVMTWNAFKGKLVYRGIEYGSKGHEFERVIGLPQRVGISLQVAVGGVNPPLARLESAGWRVIDGPSATISPQQYQDLIAASRAEFSVAKHVYSALRTGWFSCRSACYMAAGRPVVVQDTGFSALLPMGEGVLPFTDLEGAVTAITEVENDHPRHARAAREIAATYFASEKVLTALIDEAMNRG